MPHRYMKLPNIKWIISVMFLSTTNIPPAHDTWQSYLYPPCTVHNEAQHRRVDTSQYLNELISNSESRKPTQQFKIQSSISNNNAHENWKPPKNISSKLKIKLRVSLHETPDSCRSTFQFINHPDDKKKSPPQFQTKPAATIKNATFSSHAKY